MTTFMSDINSEGILRGKPLDGLCGLYDATTTQYYPIGMKLPLYDTTFRYCRAAEAIPLPHRGSPNLAYLPWKTAQGASARGYGVNAAKKGDKKLTVKVDDAIADNAPNGGLHKNWFAGGSAVIFNIAGDNGIIGRFRISGSEKSVAYDATYDTIDIYLDQAIPWDLTPTASPATSVDLYPSPYMNQGAGASVGTHGRVTVIPLIAIDSGSFFWGQTLGPCWVTPTVGITAGGDHEVVFHTNGTVKVRSTDYEAQRAGYMIMRGDNSNDDSLLMLDLE